MKKLLALLCAAAILGCSASKKTGASLKSDDGDAGAGHTRTKPVASINESTYLITEYSTDKTYGYTQNNAVKVGGNSESSGPVNERKFLNGLLGPNGEPLKYFRSGSCCAFKTPNGLIGGMGLLDRYRVYWDGSTDTLSIYINMYDRGDLYVPVGLTAKKK